MILRGSLLLAEKASVLVVRGRDNQVRSRRDAGPCAKAPAGGVTVRVREEASVSPLQPPSLRGPSRNLLLDLEEILAKSGRNLIK